MHVDGKILKCEKEVRGGAGKCADVPKKDSFIRSVGGDGKFMRAIMYKLWKEHFKCHF